MGESVRTHIIVPRDLVAEVDRLVGERKRSEFVAQALREKLARERQGRALQESAGSLDPSRHPEWQTSAGVSAWVRELCAADDGTARCKP